MSTRLTTDNIVPTKAEQRLSRRALLGRIGALTGGAIVAGSMLGLATHASAATTDTMTTSADAMPMTVDVTAVGATMAVPGATVENPFGTLANLSSDLDIFNFALLLEYLEADFYSRIVAAHNARPYLRDRVPFVANKLMSDENTHVAAILDRIVKAGGTPVAKPLFQFPANVFVSQTGFLTLSTALEETGVGAYLGAAPLIKGREYLQFAASIYGVEARHTGMIRLLSGRTFAPEAKEAPFTAMQVVMRAAPYIVTTGLPSSSTTTDTTMPMSG